MQDSIIQANARAANRRLKNPPYATRVNPSAASVAAVVGWPPFGQVLRDNAFVIPDELDVAALNLGVCLGRHVFVSPGDLDRRVDDDRMSAICRAIVAVGAASVIAYNGAELCAEWWRDPQPWLGWEDQS